MKYIKKDFFFRFFSLMVIILFISGCQSENDTEQAKPTIAISKTVSSKKYQKWLKKADSNFRFINLYDLSVDSAVKTLDECSGFLLTGGEDIHPSWYNQPGDTVKCNTINLRRDSLEYYALREAFVLEIPVLGICRGMQMINVGAGGSLIPDIPSRKGKEILHREAPFEDVFHTVTINQASLLYSITKTNKIKVLSNHHQGIDKMSEKLREVAHTPDNIPEAVEWKEPYNKPFLLGVQFHPEAMDWNSSVSKPLAKKFLRAVRRSFNRKSQN
ncbi:MAG: gamma-glutamyl-gamma-aminobutyrate hydrolase family protein [Bacteroidales bacterium]|nr:gamma-glutamyl-gamma-aminobutyrate hydrolase family protein [Bacteroidales bacterium]